MAATQGRLGDFIVENPTFFVTAVDAAGHESAFSDPVWLPWEIALASEVVVLPTGERLVAGGDTGGVLRQRADGVFLGFAAWRMVSGFRHFTADAWGRLLLSRPDLGETSISGGSLRLVTDDPDQARAVLPELLAKAGASFESVTPDRPTLEDVFVQLVRTSNA